jgi:uncharacterized protein
MTQAVQPVKFAALNLTHNCNLRCRYCYSGDKIKSSMTLPTATRAIDFLADQTDQTCVVTFFGGEPLTEYRLLKEIVLYSEKQYGRCIQFRMSTNGTLLKQERLDFFKDHGVYFVLSLDGNKAQHDTCRCFADNRGSYDKIIRNLDAVFTFNPYPIAVSVIVPDTVRYVADGVRDLYDRGFRYVLQTLDYSAPWHPKHLSELEKQYKALARYYYDCLSTDKKIFYSPFDERIKTHAQKPYTNGDLCDLANTQIAIAPSGKIYPCVQFIGTDDDICRKHIIGDVETGFDNDRRLYFIEENYRDKDSCEGCALAGRCATYCGCVNWRATGSLNTIPPIICEHERMLMPITDRLANRLWKNDITLFKRKFYEPTFPVSSYIEDCCTAGGKEHAQG